MSEILIIISLFIFAASSYFSIQSVILKSNINYRIPAFLFATGIILFLAAGSVKVFNTESITSEYLSINIWTYFYLFITALIACTVYIMASGKWKKQWRAILLFSGTFICLIIIISLFFLNSSRKINITIPENIAVWILPLHIFFTFTGELFFFFTFAGSGIYLLLERNLRRKKLPGMNNMPSLETVDRFNNWAIARSLVLITFGITSGMLMVFFRYDSLFQGTAKEMHIYFSWIIIAGIYILRRSMRINSRYGSIINILLFILVMFLFIFTNIYITGGFHSFR